MSDKNDEKNQSTSNSDQSDETANLDSGASSLIDVSTPQEVVKFGTWLKSQREEKKISLEEIAAVTKIHIVQLRNIEENQLDDLPSLAFVRGFLVNYARHIGIDEDDVLERFRKYRNIDAAPGNLIKRRGAVPSSQPKVRVVHSSQIKKAPGSKADEKPKEFPLKKNQIIALGIVLLLIATISLLVSIGNRSESERNVMGPQQAAEIDGIEALPMEESGSTTPVVTDIGIETKTAPSPSAPPPAKTTSAPAIPTSVVTVPAPKVEPPKPTPDPVSSNPVKPEVVTTLPATAAPIPTPAQPVDNRPDIGTLEVRGLDPSWVKVRVDSRDAEGFQLDKGKTNRYGVKSKIVLSLSNAGAVEIRWNNKWYEPIGFRGDVKSITLPDQLDVLKPKP